MAGKTSKQSAKAAAEPVTAKPVLSRAAPPSSPPG
jgi:hypothetical protein